MAKVKDTHEIQLQILTRAHKYIQLAPPLVKCSCLLFLGPPNLLLIGHSNKCLCEIGSFKNFRLQSYT